MKEWIMIKDLINVGELPGTTQGITLRAKKENWQRRRVEGKKGNVFEYYVGDMPESVQAALGFTEPVAPLYEGLNLIPTAPKPGENALVSIPFFHTAVSAGLGAVTEAVSMPLPDDYIGLSEQWLWTRGLHRQHLVFLLTTGDSMEPTIHHRDMLLIDRSAVLPRDGEIYVIRVGEQLWVKRVQGLVNGIRLISDNRALYEPIDVFFDDATNVEILGRVVFVGHSLI